MATLFSDKWMQKLMDKWNNAPELANELSIHGFNSTIAYGFDDEEEPRGVLVVENGKAISATVFADQIVNWDLRASKNNWKMWLSKPPGMMDLGMAYTSHKLKFNKGDYTTMIKDPHMAGPFVKSFIVMGRV